MSTLDTLDLHGGAQQATASLEILWVKFFDDISPGQSRSLDNTWPAGTLQ